MLALNHILLAAEPPTSESLRALKLDTPESFEGWLGLAALVAVVLAYVVWMYVRDTRAHSPFATAWLLLLRVAALAGLLVVWLNPQERTQKMSFRPSRVAVLVDTSLSMDFPETVPPAGGGSTGSPPVRSRMEAIRELLARSPAIEELRQRHEVSLYTFDTKLEEEAWRVFYAYNDRAAAAAARKARAAASQTPDPSAQPSPDEWNEWLRPRGLETRLGEALLDAMKKFGGRTLSGIVVLTDGGSNAGVDPNSAHDYAVANQTRLVTIGLGSTEKQVNLKIARVQAPTDVHVGDAYDVSAFVQGQGLAGRTAQLELLVQPVDNPDAEATVVGTQEVVLDEDGVPVEARFTRDPSQAGELRYAVRAELLANLPESFSDDNREEFTVNIVDRKLRVLLVAGGPTRDYRFVRNMLYRHPAIDVNVWLQSVDPATIQFVSQESDDMLTSFPQEPAELIDRDSGYDVIIFFDPDCSQLTEEQRKLLVDWIDNHSGGAIFVAGDVNTPSLAGGEELQNIRELFPVFLSSYLLDYQFDSDSDQPWPIGFTREGENAGLLQLAEDPAASAKIWKEFEGVYRTYPTAGAKAGATVYAEFTDTRAQTEHGQPILMASQFYGAGRTFYIGSPEIWRLRSLSDEYYDRFWTKLIREVGQGRLNRGTSRGMLVPERKEYYLGQTVRVRARLLDAQYQPLVQDSIVMEVYDPSGKLLTPARQLLADKNRPGEYFGDFRASLPGRYKLELPIPDSNKPELAEVNVSLPDLEAARPEQDAATLMRLAQDTGGRYLRLEDVPAQLASLLPDRSEEFMVDERLRTLWDRDWVLFLIVGLLSVEWLTRKLLKLA